MGSIERADGIRRLDRDDIKARLLDQLEDLAHRLLSEPNRRLSTKREWRWGTKGSLKLTLTGRNQGRWYDFEAGTGGDVFTLIQREIGGNFPAALAWAAEWLGLSTTDQRQPQRQRLSPRLNAAPQAACDDSADPATAAKRERARQIWQETIPAAGTLVEYYLPGRGITCPIPEAVRFHPACPRGQDRLPAMVALMTDPVTGAPVGIHRTFLKPDGSDRLRDDKGKMMLGAAGVIRLSPDEEVTQGLGLAEGIETGLSCISAGFEPVWAATSSGAMARFPVLAGIDALTLFADADGPGAKAAEACADRWTLAEREVEICTPQAPDSDWNDTLRRVGLVAPVAMGKEGDDV